MQYGVKVTRMHVEAERITERFFDGGTVQGPQGDE